jgi:hypothetical protein
MRDDEPTTKGAILRSLLKFVQGELSAGEYAEALAAMPEGDRPVLERGRILPSEKVSEFLLNRLTVAAARSKGESVETFGRRAGKAELADAVGVYKFLTILLTPRALLQKASSLWSTIHSHGELTITEETPTSAVVTLVRFPSEPAHCARLSGWFEGAGELTRVKDISVTHPVCIAKGAEECVWRLAWSK